jgi:hypothetical protein
MDWTVIPATVTAVALKLAAGLALYRWGAD